MKEENLILGPYKEPLKKVETGFGYYGALSFTVSGKIQCHECGEPFDNLSFHVPHKHKITIKEYRAKYGIAMSSKLISEAWRNAAKERMLNYINGLSDEERAERTKRFTDNAIKRNKERGASTFGKSNLSAEEVNVRGICPDQLIALINDAREHYGYTPSMIEFNDYYKTARYQAPIRRTFGSWKKAVLSAGLHPKKKQHGGHVRYTDDEMLGFLTVFWEENGVIPTSSDIGRGYLPTWSAYIRRFGTMAEARRLAGVPEWSREHYRIAQEKKSIVKI